jgi:hypothetical protein
LYNTLLFLVAWLFSVLAGVLTLNLEDDDGPGTEADETHNVYINTTHRIYNFVTKLDLGRPLGRALE